MIRKDYILRMVEEFARFMAVVLGLKDEGKFQEALKKIDGIYTGMLKLDPRAIKAVGSDELLDFLQAEKKFENHYLKMIAELLYEEGLIYVEIGDPIGAKNVLEKSKLLINYLMDNDSTFSLDWEGKLSTIDGVLSH